MLYLTLICSDEACAAEVEWWGELDESDALACEGCGCVLQVVDVSEAAPPPAPAPISLRAAA